MKQRHHPRLSSPTRREVLGLIALGAAAVAVGGCDDLAPLSPVRSLGFKQRLWIPPEVRPQVDASGGWVFNLTARTGRRELTPGTATQTWGINGDYLGPTLRAPRGQQITINLRNLLPETTTMHWHGAHLPAAADGGPHQPIDPGATWSPTWRINQPAATLWYHPHPHGHSEMHVYRGLAGMFIIDDEEEAALPLPRTYGVDDIPVIIQDKRFGPDGQLDGSDHTPVGLLGDTILVNGTAGPYFHATTELIRLRLLNASTARVYNLGFSDGRRFAVIGTDGGLLPAPHPTHRVQLAPGERAEIVVRLTPGEKAVLRSYRPELGTIPVMTRISGGLDAFDVLQLRASSSSRRPTAVPRRLADLSRVDAGSAVVTRSFLLAGRQINGKQMDLQRIDELVTLDTTEVWEVINLDAQPHSFHVHGLQFQVADVADAQPPAFLDGRKDTVFLPPGIPVRLVLHFADYADPARPFMYHCHMLFHEDHGMMGQFLVVAAGQQPELPADVAGDHEHHH